MAGEANSKKHEVFGFLLLLLASLLLLCLWTHTPSDSSLNALSHKGVAENTIGPWGAYISDLLFQILGYSSFLLLCPLLTVSLKLMLGKQFRSPYFSAIGFILILVSTSSGLELFPFKAGSFDFKPGGMTGVVLSGLLMPNFNRTGTLIIIIGAFVIGMLAATPFSFSKIFFFLKHRPENSRYGLLERFRQWRAGRKTAIRAVNGQKPAAISDPPPMLTPVKLPSSAPSSAENRQFAPIIRPAEKEQPRLPASERPAERSAERAATRRFLLPPIDLLTAGENACPADEAELMEQARMISEKCAEFDVHGSITQIHPGPVVTTFEFKPDAGIKYSKITGLVDDLCLGIKAESLRIDRIPGKATVGIEVPNSKREIIMLRELMESDVFVKSSSRLTLALGKLINGNAYVTDLAKMPHLLIAGATGAGKSVALNCMITSILYKATSDEVRFIFIDPKRLELGLYADIPHLLTPIVTDPGEAANALRWVTNEMEQRYKKLARRGVRNIDQYNSLLRNSGMKLPPLDGQNEGEYEKPLSYLVIVIDELADLMMVASKEVEESISRLAAMARAVGIHLILATQRPSVDVITGIIKANFPCRIAFKVASKVDSRTIIDGNGAELLLGNGDMLFIPPGTARLTRIHGAYVSEKEAQAIVEHLRKQGRPAYDDSILNYGQEETDEAGNPLDGNALDPLYKDAVRIVVSEGRASTSLLQRRLSIGYGRAAKLVDLMHDHNIVGPADGSKPREVLVGLDFLDRLQDI